MAKDVGFANTLYVEEVRIVVKANSGIKSISDLNGKQVATITGTTSVQLLRKHERANGVKIVGEVLSTEPIAIMVRKDDPEFKVAINSAIAKIVANGKMPGLWNKWFLALIPPKNIGVGLELSSATKKCFGKFE